MRRIQHSILEIPTNELVIATSKMPKTLDEVCHIEFTVLEDLKKWLKEGNFPIFAKKIDEFEEQRFDADNLNIK